jgi:outer membrane protein
MMSSPCRALGYGEVMIRNVITALLFGAALSAMTAGPAMADSLFGAMEKAYATNPTLNGDRAGQRATDELVPQALSGWRPTITVNGELSHNWEKSGNTNFEADENDSGTVSIELRQPLFRGFRTVEGTKAAEARVDAGRQNLLQTEQDVLFNVVQAYMNVYSGRQLVMLQRQNVAAFRSQLGASNERFSVGEITRTDVAQARSRLAEAQTLLTNAEAALAGDVAEYFQIIGNEPGKLKYPPIVKLPKSLKSAFAMAAETNPRILARAFVEVASQHDIEVQRGELLPEVSLNASAQASDVFGDGRDTTKIASVSAQVRIPIYEAGLIYSQVREAKQLASQQRIAVIEIARAVRQIVASTWNAYVGLGDIIRYARTQVSAAELALSGVQQEYQAGTRTTLDVLDAQSELVNARTTLVTAERDRVVAAYQLLGAVGRLTAKDLGLSVVLYDPEQNYDRVRNKWIGTNVETLE